MMLPDKFPFEDRALIGSRWIGADYHGKMAVTDPATGALIAEVPALTADDAAAAIEAAQSALPGWKAQTASARAEHLRRWCNLVITHKEALAAILTAEQGKPLTEARGEIDYAASFIQWFAEEARRVEGEIIPAPRAGQTIMVQHEAVGVIAAITPWNFPAAMVTRKLAPALAAGCTAILKPAPDTPLTALALAALAREAGIPDGVINVVTGDASVIGPVLMESPLVRKLSFTGSTPVGRLLFAQAAPTLKRLSLELGGNAPLLVFDDADLDKAVDGAIYGKFRNAGQTCVCINRFLVQRGVYDRFAEKLAPRVAGLCVGNGFEEGVHIGPLINEAAVAKTERHVADALARGGTIILGGERRGGRFYAPTLIRDVPADALVAREETFGPLAALIPFDSEEEAIALANASEFGLAAYAYTRDLGRAIRVSGALEYGMVGINETAISTEVAPFGGIKASGLGREGSRHGIYEYLDLKYVLLAS